MSISIGYFDCYTVSVRDLSFKTATTLTIFYLFKDLKAYLSLNQHHQTSA